MNVAAVVLVVCWCVAVLTLIGLTAWEMVRADRIAKRAMAENDSWLHHYRSGTLDEHYRQARR